MRNLLLSFWLLCSSIIVHSQTLPFKTSKSAKKAWGNSTTTAKITPIKRNCYTTQMEEKLQQKYPNRRSTKQFETDFQKQLKKSITAKTTQAEEHIYFIPTIVHVIHNGEAIGEGANITEEQVLSQFDVLNEDFRRLGAGYNDHPDGADIQIEFVPAALDPEGNPLAQPGINRINGGSASWANDPIESTLKPSTIWDPDLYFNIWVVEFGGDLGDVLGYAQFPSLSGLGGLEEDEGLASTDGIVIRHQFFGTTGTVNSPYDGGRTVTHETGHWLGLRHIWGDGGCDVDDYCADTPKAGAENYGCSSFDSCPGDGLLDMIENYMDYTDDACMNIFTQDQKDRMRTVLEVCPRRNTLTNTALCSESIVIAEGTHTTTPSAWYTYKATSEVVVTASSLGQTTEDTYLLLYTGCDASPINSNDDAAESLQSELSTLVQAGDSLLIYWANVNSQAAFNWTLSSTTPSTGIACDLAATASTGSNSVPVTSSNTYWFHYTLTSDDAKLIIDGQGNPYEVFAGDCSQLESLGQHDETSILYNVQNGETVFIAFYTHANDNFTWDLDEQPLEIGEACVSADTATQGTNVAPSGTYWYTYTMPVPGHLLISTDTASAIIAAYGDCDSEPIALSDNLQLEVNYLAAGEEIKIQWDFNHGEFNWDLEVTELEPGEACLAPATAQEGVNSAPGAPYWYTFTMPEDGNLVVSSVGHTEEDTYVFIYDECGGSLLAENDDAGNLYQSLAFTYLLQGESVVIYWSNEYSSASFNWEIIIQEPQTGDECDSPATAVIGTNTTPVSALQDYWTSFTIPENNKKLVISSETSHFVAVTTADCDDLSEFGESDNGNLVFLDLAMGDEILIVWEYPKDGPFNWEISMEDFEEGDLCTDPVVANTGINTSPYAPFWYSFTMPEDGDLKVSSVNLTDNDTYLFIYDECDGVLLGESDDAENYQSELVLEGLTQGESIIIYWSNKYSSASFDWEITVDVPGPGESCELPATAKLEVNETPSAPYWFEYTLPKEADLTVSAVGLTEEDTYVSVFSDCEGTLLAENNDFSDSLTQSEVTIQGLKAGEKVYIYWNPSLSSNGFNWELELTNVVNTTPVIEDQSFKATLVKNGDVIGTVQATDADDDRLAFSITAGNENKAYAIAASGQLSISDIDALSNTSGPSSLEITVSDGFASDKATITVNWSTVLGTGLEISHTLYPNPNPGILKITNPGSVERIEILNISGQEVLRTTDILSPVDVSHFTNGIYVVKIYTDSKTSIERLIIKR